MDNSRPPINIPEDLWTKVFPEAEFQFPAEEESKISSSLAPLDGTCIFSQAQEKLPYLSPDENGYVEMVVDDKKSEIEIQNCDGRVTITMIVEPVDENEGCICWVDLSKEQAQILGKTILLYAETLPTPE